MVKEWRCDDQWPTSARANGETEKSSPTKAHRAEGGRSRPLRADGNTTSLRHINDAEHDGEGMERIGDEPSES